MQASQRPLALLVVGWTLLMASLAAPRFFSGNRVWSDDQARAYTEAAAAYHSAKLGAHSHAIGDTKHGNSQPIEAVEEAERRFLAEQNRLEAAQHRGSFVAWSLRLLGLLSLIAGVGLWWRGRGKGEE